jgi:hypothetical protein
MTLLMYQLMRPIFHPDRRLGQVPVSILRHGYRARVFNLSQAALCLIMKLAVNDNKPQYAHPVFWVRFIAVHKGRGR